MPASRPSCRAAIPPFIGGYVVDGHVPIEAVRKLLAEQPPLKGMTLPGMPPGSPGMAGTKEGPFTVYAIDRDGKVRVRWLTIDPARGSQADAVGNLEQLGSA